MKKIIVAIIVVGTFILSVSMYNKVIQNEENDNSFMENSKVGYIDRPEL